MAVDSDIFPPRYRGAQRIARGGMGEIFRATDSTLGRAVAIKILAQRYANDDEVRARFTREALAAARLSGQENTVTIYDVGEHNDRPYIVMEYLGGGSLEDVLGEEGAQPPRRAFTWLEQAGAALDAAHREGVVHRDVKPANLMLDRVGNVHVADFGIASAAGLDSLTMTGTVLGTAGYLSPEQATGDRATPASDRYALGVVAYELLTGKRPFAADSTTAEAAAHVNAPVPSVSDGRVLPVELDSVFGKALAKDPGERYDSCAEFVAALRGAMADAAGSTRELAPVPAAAQSEATWPVRREGRRDEYYAPPPPVYSRPARSSRWPLLAVLLVAGLVGGAFAAYFLTRDTGNHAAAPAGQKVKTVTSTSTVTQQTTTAAVPPPTPDGHALNDAGFRKLQAGDFGGAVPLLQQAVERLSGAGPRDPYEAFANYNLGYSLLKLNRCGEAIPYLQKADSLEPWRHEPRKALKRAEKCA